MASKTHTTRYSTFNKEMALFQTTVDLDSTASSAAAGATWFVLPCYNVEWIDVEISIPDTNSITLKITQDYSGGSKVLPTQEYSLAKNATYHCLAIVPGTPSNLAVTNGSHTVTCKLVNDSGAATCTGKVHLYGHRKV